VTYNCSPSGLSGTTSSSGAFTCQTGDSVTFSLSVQGGVIHLGSIAVPNTGATSIPVTMLSNGLQIAEILQALNHSATSDMDVTGLTIPATVVAEINSYITTGGTLPTGYASDDQFLAYMQSQVTADTPLAIKVSGTSKSFLQNTVLPNLQNAIIAISSTNPAPAVSNGTTKLSGTILVNGGATIPATAGASAITVAASGGGILNATVNGNVQAPGTYTATFSSPGFIETVTVSSFTVTSGGVTTTIPGSTTTVTVPPFNGTGTITVSGSTGNLMLTMPNPNYSPPAGCTGGSTISGTNVGLSNPLVTLSTEVSCTVQSATVTVGATAKLVGAW
jgi:hypothetical protein